MLKRPHHFERFQSAYLFSEIEARKAEFLKKRPEAQLVSLGIGDTKLPLPSVVVEALVRAAAELGTEEGYSGYGRTEGMNLLREALVRRFYPHLSPSEIFISDGAKSDLGRLQMIFGSKCVVAVQDPAYPVYLEGSLFQEVEGLHLLPCLPENHFLPSLPEGIDLLYLCNPNNPTGKALTFEELEAVVRCAEKNRFLIIYDGAYAAYIQDPTRYPSSIYAIEGAERVAIEVNSFSKLAGFTGVRLGWSVIPKALTFSCGGSIWKDFSRFNQLLFNGASNIAQKGGLAVLSDEGYGATQRSIALTMENAALLKAAFERAGYTVYGGKHAPYLWIHTPDIPSWELFQIFLEEKELIVTPGSGYGLSGEHFIRVSAFGKPSTIRSILERIAP